ncbi:hypothetical protein [Streptomyces sp. NPDC002671]
MQEEGAIVLGTGGESYAGNSAGNELPPSAAGQAVVHDGYSSVFTIDACSDDLQETYLTAMGAAWTTQDLSDKYHTPPAREAPLRETYLSGIGASWITQDFTTKYGTPPAY